MPLQSYTLAYNLVPNQNISQKTPTPHQKKFLADNIIVLLELCDSLALYPVVLCEWPCLICVWWSRLLLLRVFIKVALMQHILIPVT
jgi:hypothetical protein